MDIDTMPADRKMDALIAESMGYYDAHELQEDSMRDQDIAHRYGWLYIGNWVRCSKANLDLDDYNNLLHYSTDIATAWEVVTWLLEKGHYFTISPHTFYIPPAWVIYLDTVPEVIGATFPLAICRAALKAVKDQ